LGYSGTVSRSQSRWRSGPGPRRPDHPI